VLINLDAMYRRRRRTRRRQTNAKKLWIPHAFSARSTGSKIFDGKAPFTCALKEQKRVEIVQSNGNSKIRVLLCPGLATPMACSPNATDATGKSIYYENNATYNTSGSNTYITQATGRTITKWRIVSQAIRLTLLNNSDENDGWYEAARFSPPIDEYRVNPKKLTTGYVIPEMTSNYMDSFTDLTNLNSYTSGKVRDIHKRTFSLTHVSNNHDFIAMDTQYKFGYNIVEDAINYDDEYNEWNDKHFDKHMNWYIIDIHGRTASTEHSGTKILAHMITNYEFIFGPDNIACKLATSNTMQTEALTS
jgi:hypothetical protein